MRLTKIFFKSLSDLLNWQIIKLALLVGIPLAILWFILGFLLWDNLFNLITVLISWVPFSVLKSSLSFMIGSFGWILLVLITYALIMAFFNVPIFSKLNPKNYEIFNLILLILISAFWSFITFLNWSFIYNKLSIILTWFPYQTLEEIFASMVTFLIFYNLFIVSLYIFVLIFNKSFLDTIILKDYENINLKKIKPIKNLSFTKKIIIYFIALFIAFPLLFIPFVNILIQLFLWAYLVKDVYFISVARYYLSKEEIDKLNSKKIYKWIIAFLSSLLNLIPVVNIFSPFLAQTYYLHWIMQEQEK
jgi:hypothetical protein